MFSYRDLKAITLLDRLNKSKGAEEQEALLGALYNTPSQLSIKGLLERAKSPRLSIRTESIHALETLDTLNEDAEKALLFDIANNPYTTAYISARILGNHRCERAIPLLREAALSGDYMLAGEAMIALARIGDDAFRPQIEEIIANTQNPRLKIMGVETFEIYRSPNSVPVLMDILRQKDPPPYLRDEVVLAMAGILGTGKEFYPLLVRYLENKSLAVILAVDEAESAVEYYAAALGGWKTAERKSRYRKSTAQARALQSAVEAYIRDKNGVPLSRWITELPDDPENNFVQVILSEAVLDDELAAHNRLRLLICHWASQKLRAWADRYKFNGAR
jgi:HEAT repeat protein